MKEFTAGGHCFDVGEFKKLLSYQGSSNCETVCFTMEKTCENIDLSQCSCTIKTKNSTGKSDVILPEVQILGDKINVLWNVSSASTSVPGKLLAQIEFDKILDDNTKNIVWQSNIMEFEIQESLASADEVYDQNPTLFQQWEERVNTVFSDVSAGVKSVQALESQVQTTADKISGQEQDILQVQAQTAQKAAEAQNSAQGALTSAVQAKASETNALTFESLSKGYSDAASTYSQAADASAKSAQQQAASAKADADRAKETVDGFSGYTKQETDNRFANAFIGEKTGPSVSLDDIQENTSLRSLLVNGQTTETCTGTKSPANPSVLSGTAKLDVSNDTVLQHYPLPQPLYSLPDGVCDSYSIPSGVVTQMVGKIIFNGTETWSVYGASGNDTTICFYERSITGRLAGDSCKSICDRFAYLSNLIISSTVTSEGYWPHANQSLASFCYFRINKARMTGWSDSLTDTQKVALFSAWLAQNPTTVLYELAVPIQISFAQQQIPAYSPNSRLSVDSGTLTVKYNRDSNKVLEKLKNAIIALGGNLD